MSRSQPRRLHPNREALAVVVPSSHDLRALERDVDGFRTSGIAAGKALTLIRNEKLYRQDGYSTFEEYLSKRWDFRPRQAQLLMAAHMVCDQLIALGVSPPTLESHARELAKLDDPEEQARAWAAAVEAAGDKPVTAKMVRAEVKKLLPAPEPKPSDINPLAKSAAAYTHIEREIDAMQARWLRDFGSLDALLQIFTQRAAMCKGSEAAQ